MIPIGLINIIYFSDRDENHGLSDFDIMLQRKKEEGNRKRKRKDIDIINDNDDIIAGLLGDMKNAADVRDVISID